MDFHQIVQLLGGLAVFLFGMRMLSEALQETAGAGLKRILQIMTRNRFTGILSGLLVTIGVQSSSATTVMLVGFVNAGLVSLTQSVGVVMGANIGTTVTAWLIAFLGFKVSISDFALPAVAIGVALQMIRRDRWGSLGAAIAGFGFLFLGLMFLKDAVPDAAKNPETFEFLRQYAGPGFGVTLVFVVIGTLLTIVIQSSSATAAITIALTFNGLIPLHAALGMILGENIGTTITANIAAIAGSRTAKKTALAHTLFNVIGVVWALALFTPLTAWVQWLFPGEVTADREVTRFQIAAFHTTFNVLNTVLLVGFARTIAGASSRIVDFFGAKAIDQFNEGQRLEEELQYLGGYAPVSTAGLEILESDELNRRLTRRTLKCVRKTEALLRNYDARKVKGIFQLEAEIDLLQNRMVHFLEELAAAGGGRRIVEEALVNIERIKSLERVADLCARIARKTWRARRENVDLSEDDSAALAEIVEFLSRQTALLRESYANLDDAAFRRDSARLQKETEERITAALEKAESRRKKSRRKLLQFFYFEDLLGTLRSVSRHMHRIAEPGRHA